MDVDQALNAAHPFGRTQILVTIAACLTQVQMAWIALSTVFLAEIVEPECLGDSNNNSTVNESATCKDGVCPEFHHIHNPSNEAGGCCRTGWEYDTKLTGVSIVSEWNLVCTRDYLPDLSQSILMAGYAVGSIVAGPLADKYGRRPTQLVSVIVVTLAGFAVPLSPNYFVYVSLRFICGVVVMVSPEPRGFYPVTQILNIPSTTLLLEYLIPRYRGIVGSIPFCASSIGLMVLPGIAYYIRDWRYFHLVIVLPSVVFLLFCWFIPESVRWIMSNGDTAKAEKTIQSIAKFHNVTDFPSDMFYEESSRTLLPSQVLSNHEAGANEQTTASEGKEETTIQILLNLFRRPTVTVTFILSWNWATYLMVYFGFALTTGTLAGNIYLNFFLISLVDFPARFVSLFIVKKVGTIPMVSLGYSSSALTLVSIVVLSFVNEDGSINKWVPTSLALLGKFFVSMSLAAINLMMSDLFPTTVRLTIANRNSLERGGGGVAERWLRAGGEEVAVKNKFVPNLAFMTISACAFIGAGLSLFLPESVRTTQPDTPADLQNLFDTKRRFRRNRGRHSRMQNDKGDQLPGDPERGPLNRLEV
ncbi:Solute carrier family 22 member 8 [Holothuria leucospilota]|uniref:Solute carrier family 22 member 8 n=1 Tax=Holothuria leucospilota TaxID=206669 RepID=A0A9Q1H3M9_HOLLE|nr:Solute carrier family 22 member 8 [Holothuria leucospilota]